LSSAAELRRKDLWADKRFGQHFLLDPSILRRIVAAAGDLRDVTVLEVGPGPGGLTRSLLEAGVTRLVAVERDPRFVTHLRDLKLEAGRRLEIVEGDALALDPCTLTEDGRPLRIVANLPYNVATPLLFAWLDHLACIELMVLMFQKEVALRLAAAPGGGDYGRLSVMVQSSCRVERLFDLPPAAFTPPPKVSSSVVRLTPLPERPASDLHQALIAVTRAAFGQRRKMLRQSLRALGGDPMALLAAAGIEPTRRAEELSLDEFRRLAALQLAARGQARP
jgi:16S rRNA (adenine1518-N6/adenine1519-N6)-dimethyltransferase